MDKNKTRIRKEYELKKQAQGLIDVRNVLEKLKIPYLIGGGTLLGIVRQGDFIPWDWDVHINLKTEDVYKNRQQIINSFVKEMFTIEKIDDSMRNFKIVVKKFDTEYELLGWLKKGDSRYRDNYKLPNKFFAEPELRKLRGESYKCMAPAEDYLEYKYGDWKTPYRSDNKDKYLSSNFHRNPKILRFILKRFRRIKKKAYQKGIRF